LHGILVVAGKLAEPPTFGRPGLTGAIQFHLGSAAVPAAPVGVAPTGPSSDEDAPFGE